MKTEETCFDFCQLNRNAFSNSGQFNIYRREELDLCASPVKTNRRDFYKISLIVKGSGTGLYGEETFQIKDNILSFSNPLTPFSWRPTTRIQTGYFCVFTEEFISPALKVGNLGQSSLFKAGGNHLFCPDKTRMDHLDYVFSRMLAEANETYANKYDVLRSYVQIILHEAIKMHPFDPVSHHANAGRRISAQFLELLEAQFPIESLKQAIGLKTANEFAAHLSVDISHLNRVLKEITGKTTTELIAGRIAKEARILLLNSNWSISEISYCLGFEYPSNFNSFFKKQTQQTPSQFRCQIIAIS